MDFEELLRSNLPLIERIVGRVCRRANVQGADVEDFSSTVKLALVDDDYAILRAWEGRSSLATYLSIVIQRLLSDERNRTLGRWRPSSEAKRMGEAAVLLETLLRRDQRSLDEALPIVQGVDPSLGRAEIEALAGRLPQRGARLRAVPLDDAEEVATNEQADARALDGELDRMSERASAIIRTLLAGLSIADRTMMRLRFASNMNISDIARILQCPQRPLYRRMEAVMSSMRTALESGGIDARMAGDLHGCAVAALDFGLNDGKTAAASQSPLSDDLGRLEDLR
jgi:RNA polymerase sigma factor (sigma-70 family)